MNSFIWVLCPLVVIKLITTMQCPSMKENEASSTSFKYQTVKVLMITVWLVLFFFENVCVCVCLCVIMEKYDPGDSCSRRCHKDGFRYFFKYLYVCLCAWLYIFNMHCLTYE